MVGTARLYLLMRITPDTRLFYEWDIGSTDKSKRISFGSIKILGMIIYLFCLLYGPAFYGEDRVLNLPYLILILVHAVAY